MFNFNLPPIVIRFGYKVTIVYKPRLRCTLAQLLKEFEAAFPKLNLISQKIKSTSSSQNDKWQDFYIHSLMPYPNFCAAIKIMYSVAVNTGWIERAYSILEQICSKKRNKLSPATMRHLFLLAVLKLEVVRVIDNAGKTFKEF